MQCTHASFTYVQTSVPAVSSFEGSYLPLASWLPLNANVKTSPFLPPLWIDETFQQRMIDSNPYRASNPCFLGRIAWYGIPLSFSCLHDQPSKHLANPSADRWRDLPPPSRMFVSSASRSNGLFQISHNLRIPRVLVIAISSSTSVVIIAVNPIRGFEVHKP